MAKNLQNSHFFYLFVVIKDPSKEIRNTELKFYFHNFLGNIVVNTEARNWKDPMKTEGAHSIWKKVDNGWMGGWTDGRIWQTAQQRISSADYVSSGDTYSNLSVLQ